MLRFYDDLLSREDEWDGTEKSMWKLLHNFSVIIWPLLVSSGLFLAVAISSVHQGSPGALLKGQRSWSCFSWQSKSIPMTYVR